MAGFRYGKAVTYVPIFMCFVLTAQAVVSVHCSYQSFFGSKKLTNWSPVPAISKFSLSTCINCCMSLSIGAFARKATPNLSLSFCSNFI